MSLFGRVLCCLLACAPLVWGAGGSGHDEVAGKLKGKIVFLRGMQLDDKLSFDAQGVAVGDQTPGPFAYSAVKIEKVHRSRTRLEIKGQRMGLVFQTASASPSLSDIRSVPLGERVDIMIALDRSHPEMEEAAIRKMFAFSPQDALAGMSVSDERAALDAIGSTAPHYEPIPSYEGSPVYKFKPGGAVSPPRLIHYIDPAFTEDARRKRIQGVCLLSMIVDTRGRPERIRVVRSVDPGLDVNAIIAVSQYRFEPATMDGKPVPVSIEAEVTFRIY